MRLVPDPVFGEVDLIASVEELVGSASAVAEGGGFIGWLMRESGSARRAVLGPERSDRAQGSATTPEQAGALAARALIRELRAGSS
ncbi:hypothetical protein [Streptomyces sp. NBC_00344]|uniref:hypothetical protein n=1 Tax=Streptomyces sp. NBC_00344 TaxID=2975720 RepID=UPI003FA6E2CF